MLLLTKNMRSGPTVQHYLQHDSHPLVAVLDCSKAFDLAKWDTLFLRTLERKVPAVVVRALMFVYQEQFAWVQWGGQRSDMFSVTNGTRQGSCASPMLWATYCNPLLDRLRALGVGCRIGGLFAGAVLYCDDILLIAPNRHSMALMLTECEKFAAESNITFSTDPDPHKSKSKMIFMCGKQASLAKPVPLTLCGKELPWVSTALHLGHHLHEDGTLTHDIEVKRAEYIGKTMELREMLRFASPVEVLVATSVYCSDYYGSLAGWDLGSDKANMFFNAWSTHVRLTWRVPRQARTFLVQNVLAPGLTSARTEVLARYVTFFRSLRNAPSHVVRTAALLAARDLQTVTGRNLALVAELSQQDPWTASTERVREALREREMVEVPDVDSWHCKYLNKLLEERQEANYNGDSDKEIRIAHLIDSLCVS